MATLPDLPKTEIAIIQMTNAFRQEQKLGSLSSNKQLAAAARAYAAYLAKTGALSHSADGRSMDARVRAHGYRFCWLAENLSWRRETKGYTTSALAATVVTGWKNKIQTSIASILPSGVVAEQHRRMAEPGSGKKGRKK